MPAEGHRVKSALDKFIESPDECVKINGLMMSRKGKK